MGRHADPQQGLGAFGFVPVSHHRKRHRAPQRHQGPRRRCLQGGHAQDYPRR